MAVTENDAVIGPLIPAMGVSLISLDFFLEDEDFLEVYQSGSEVALILNTDYTVAGVDTDTGSVTLTVAADGVDAYSVFLIIPAERTSDFQLRGQFKSDPFNGELDLLWQATQGIKTRIDRSIETGKSTPAIPPLIFLDGDVTNDRHIKWNADSTKLVPGISEADLTALEASAAASAATATSEASDAATDAAAAAASAASMQPSAYFEFTGDTNVGLARTHGEWLLSGTITANREASLLDTDAVAGDEIRVVRTGGGTLFGWVIKDFTSAATLTTLTQNDWCTLIFDGTAWELAERGSLTNGPDLQRLLDQKTTEWNIDSPISAGYDDKFLNLSAEITADRELSLVEDTAFLNAEDAEFIYIYRTDTSNFTWSIRGIPSAVTITTLERGEWLVMGYDGTSWFVASRGDFSRKAHLETTGDAGATLAMPNTAYLHSGTITANRTVNIALAGAVAGDSITVTRTGSNGGFTFSVRDQDSAALLKVLAQNEWLVAKFDGSNWYMAQFGALV